jgi:hypothetical protein
MGKEGCNGCRSKSAEMEETASVKLDFTPAKRSMNGGALFF